MEEYEIQYKGRYLGRLMVDDRQKVQLQFTPDNLRTIDSLAADEQLGIGVEKTTAGEFRQEFIDKVAMSIDPKDGPPTDWSLMR